jgi:hypothetical protein
MAPELDHGSAAQTDRLLAARRSAALVAAAAAFLLPAWFIATLVVVGSYRDNSIPGVGAPDQDFVQFYVDNFSKIPVTSTMFVIGWVLVLVVLVAVVRALSARVTLPGILAVTLAGAFTAVGVASQGLFTYPTIALEFTAENVPANLDPGVARFLVLSAEPVQNTGGVLLGVALLMISLVAVRSDLWGHWVIAGLAAVMGAVGVLNMLLGGGGTIVIGMIPFGIIAGIVLLIARARLLARPRDPGTSEV